MNFIWVQYRSEQWGIRFLKVGLHGKQKLCQMELKWQKWFGLGFENCQTLF